MMNKTVQSAGELDFLSGGGEMGERIRNFDWSATPLGEPAGWDQSLKTIVRIMLTSRQPIWIGWGEDLIKLYNDPYIAIVGGKHPGALGQPARVVWSDIWKDIAPMLDTVMTRNEGTYVESQLLIMERYGYPEETYFTFSYSPVPGADGRTGGMICYNSAETERIINERSLDTLRRLAAEIRKESADEVLRAAVNVLSLNNRDFPFVAASHISEDGNRAYPFAFSGAEGLHPDMPKEINLSQPSDRSRYMADAVKQNTIVLFNNPGQWAWLSEGPWNIPPAEFLHVPLSVSNRPVPYATLTLALNPYRKFDAAYQNFVQLVADQLSLELNNVMAYETEKKRAEALAAIDKAKTVFFSNISHEFRTPLTLILGPLEELMRRSHSTLSGDDVLHLETTHRNALRLLKLVNTLLDFSRIEAGKQKAMFVPTDIASLTRNLASNFRSVIEKAGIGFAVEVAPVTGLVNLDRDMWEKIVFNLLSNAYKYTLNGEITVTLSEKEGKVILSVTDTGVGIPQAELPHMFDRFHRIENTAGRSYEGTGIGLSLVKELVLLHKGEISVTSREGEGSTFTVQIPAITADAEAYTTAAAPATEEARDAIYLQEVQSLQERQRHPVSAMPASKSANLPLVMVVDDNADMREHIVSVLAGEFRTVTANNGMDALLKLREHSPELIISDVMMPVLDGIGLLKEVKQNKQTARIPLILLTARAGEESRIEGWKTGADDYLVKPFSANELLARVASHINLARARNANEEGIRNLFSQMPMGIAVYKGEDLEIEMVNDTMLGYWGRTRQQAEGARLWDLLPEAKPVFSAITDEVYRTGKGFVSPEYPVRLLHDGKETVQYATFAFEPRFNEHGQVMGLLGIASDITAQVTNRKKIEESEKQLKELANAMPQLVWITNAQGVPIYFNERVSAFANSSQLPDGSWTWQPTLHPDDAEDTFAAWEKCVTEVIPYEREHRMQLKDGSFRWFLSRGYPQRDEEGKVVKWFGTATNIDDQKSFVAALETKVNERTEQLNSANEVLGAKNAELERQNEELASFSYVASHDLQEPLRKIQTFANRIQDLENDKLSDTGKDYFARMIAAAQRMQLLIEALLDYSRTNTSDKTFVETDLNLLLKEARSNLSVLVEDKKAVIEVGPLPKLQVIPHQFQQLVSNILSNSLKYSRPDVPPHISVTAEKVSGAEINNGAASKLNMYWHFRFEDNGIGFEQQYAGRIFELFQRLHGRMEYSGTGIGLAICKKIVQNHHGFISASGEPGAGARFDVYLPA